MDEYRQYGPSDDEIWGGPVLWDVGKGVCCAAYQLGACPHTEDDVADDWDDEDPQAQVWADEYQAQLTEEPF